MWLRPSWDSQYTRTETERATTPYYYTISCVYTAVTLYEERYTIYRYRQLYTAVQYSSQLVQVYIVL